MRLYYQFMKRYFSFCLILLGLLTTRPAAVAAVTWSFDYTDSTEFDTSAIGLARRASLEAAAAVVGSWLNHTATVTMKVTSSNSNTDTLASAGSNFPDEAVNGFTSSGYVRSKILTGVGNPSGADGEVDCNFFHNWALGDTVGANAYDFKSTMMHELLHALGFSSGIWQDGTDAFETPPGSPGVWPLFDKFLTNAAGTPIINRTTFALSASLWNAASIGGGTVSNPLPNGLYFSGPNAMAANGGMPIPLYSPNPWEEGSSGSHLDDFFFASQNLMMEAATDTGLGARTLTAFEFGILKDLGYSVNTPVPTVASPTSTSITTTTATLGGNITAGSPITERGIVYSLTSVNNNPAIGGSGVTKVVASGTATGVFTAAISGLTAGSGYSFKAYASNAFGAGYSSVATFTTSGITVPAPTVTGISPNSGSTSGGTAVTISGTNFTATSSVSIGGNVASNIAFVSATTLTATTPARTAGTASVVVTNSGGSNAPNALFTYVAAPTLTFQGTGTGALPDQGSRDILFNVTGVTGVIKDITVEFTFSPAHSYASDVTVVLISPGNQSHTVFVSPGDESSNLAGPYVFNDSSSSTLATAAATVGGTVDVPAGTYRTQNGSTLTALRTSFGGSGPNGQWILRFSDSATGDFGTISSARLTFVTASNGKFAIARQAGSQMLLSLTQADPNAHYDLLRSTNLQTWTVLQSLTTNSAGTASATDATPPSPKAFYRYVPRP